MFFNIFKKRQSPEPIYQPEDNTSSFYKQWRKESEEKATILANFVDISPQQLAQIFAETTDNDMLCSAVLAKRTEPDIEYICNKYRIFTQWAEKTLSDMPVQLVIDMACLGDKIGSTREFSNHAPVTKENLLTPRSTETDDSILTRAVYDTIVENPDNPDFRMAYIRAYQENPDADYGGGFAQWAMDDEKNTTGYGSCGNGCVMRISPIVAFYNNYNDVIKHVTASVMPTHNHTESIKAAVVFAGTLWMARAGADKVEILDYVKSAYTPAPTPEGYKPLYKHYTFGNTPYTTNMIEKHSLFAGFAVPMVVDHFAHAEDFESCCLSILSGFCDADTLCSMAGSLWGVFQY